MDRRTFMKLMGGLASMPIIGRIAKPLKSETVQEGIAAVGDKGMELYKMVVAKVMKEGSKVKESGRVDSYKHPDRPDITVDVNQTDGSAEIYFDTDRGSKGFAEIRKDPEVNAEELIEAEEVYKMGGDEYYKDVEEGISGGIENLEEFTRIKKNIGGSVQPYDPRASAADFARAIDMVGAGTDMQKARAVQEYGQNVQRQTLKQNLLDRVGYTQHMNEDRMLKDANIENQLMNRMGGLNVTQANPAFGLQNPFGPGIGMTMLGGAAGAYQGMQSLLGDQSIGEMIKDTYENTMGPTILANPEQLEMYNKALNRPTDPVIDQSRILEIVEQQKAAGVPDEGLITNFQQDEGGSVIPNFEKLSDGSYKDTRSGDIYGAETYASIAAGMYPNIYDPNKQSLKDGGSVDLTIITMPDISGSGVESLFKTR